MRNTKEYITHLSNSWEEVFKKGQLTLWIMLALKDGPKHMADIKMFVTKATAGAVVADDKSMYRALRRYRQTELTDFETAAGNGPDRKIYRLSSIGQEVLARFLQRNIIAPFYNPAIKSLIERGS